MAGNFIVLIAGTGLAGNRRTAAFGAAVVGMTQQVEYIAPHLSSSRGVLYRQIIDLIRRPDTLADIKGGTL